MNDYERPILGHTIMQPDLLKISDDLTAGFFEDKRNCKTFCFVNEMFEDGHPDMIDARVLADRLGGDGASSYISSLLNGLQHISPQSFLSLIREGKKAKVARKIFHSFEEEQRLLKATGNFDPSKIRPLFDELDLLEKPHISPAEFLVVGKDIQGLEIQVEWLWKMIPKRAVTVLHSPGGLGKTWFCLQLSKAISEGIPFLELPTKQCPVTYIDFENPLPVLKERVVRLNVQDVHFWTLAAKTPPPKLDSRDYAYYKNLQPGLLILDSFRSSFNGDENDSKDIAPVMDRLKEIRELGFSILVIHHTSKANERLYKGSTAISDLADHVLAFHRVRKGSLEEIDDAGDLDPNAPLSLSTAKTRFEPSRLFLNFDPTGDGFRLAADPNLEALDAIADYIAGPGCGQNQTDLIEWAKENLKIGRRESLVSILKRGEREGRWRSRKDGRRRIYDPKY